MADRQLPTGTVTFLFTDIERSTESIAAVGNARFAELQEVHRALLREAFTANEGVEVSTEGDAFFVAFARAGNAVAAALEGQRLLTGQPLRVRMGVHTGEALVRDNDYVGHDVHKAKRISDAGHGGQILLSQTTRDLVAANLPDGAVVSALGPHRFKDLSEPEPVFQVSTADLRTSFPPLRTLDVARHSLPVQLTSFVGRSSELEEIERMLAANRLVTLTGVGGSGKTRLAIQAAANEVENSPDGVFFCDLSQISDEDAVPVGLVRSLGVPDADVVSTPTVETLRAHLARRHVLVVLDNCEHLIDTIASLVQELLTSCPFLRVLATSREALEVEGEHTWSVPSLDATADGVQLFTERASAVRSAFVLTDRNARDVRAICRRLDGMPLAIELAAAQIGHLAPHQIVERLDDRFALLTGGRRRIQRQQTLQAAMDWSWDLLEERDRELLMRLTVFQGGCTLESAEEVCGEGLDVVSGLRSLVAKSLVVADDNGETVRYRLLETVRMFAEDKLLASAEAEEIRTKHRDYFVRWAERIYDELGPFTPLPRSPFEIEQDNVRAALRWSETQSRHDLVAQLLWSTDPIWNYNWAEGVRRISSALEAELDPHVRGRLLATLGSRELSPTGLGAARLRESIELLGDEPSIWLYMALQNLALQSGIEAIALQDPERADSALELARHAAVVGKALNPNWGSLPTLALGGVLMMQLRHAEAAEAFAECARDPTYRVTTYLHLEGLAVARHVRPDMWADELESAFREGVARYLSTRPRVPLFLMFDWLEQDRIDEAYALLDEFIDGARTIAPPIFMRVAVLYSAVLTATLADWERAARLLGAAMQPGIIMSAPGYAIYRHWLPKVRAELDPERARQLRDEGRAMSLDEALALAVERPPASNP